MIGLLNKNNIWLQNIPIDSQVLFDTDLYNFGPTYDDGVLIKPKLEGNIYVEGATSKEIEAHNDQFYPEKVTVLQFKTQLLTDGLKDDVENALNNLPDPDKSYALLKYEYATEFLRKDRLVQNLGAMIGLSNQDINEFFKRANNI